MSPRSFLRQLETCYAIVKANVGDVSHEQSLVQPAPAGNCLNWILGHLVATRSHVLGALNAEAVWSEAECKQYERHGPPLTNASRARPLPEIWQAYDLSQERLRATAANLTPERLAERASFSPANDPDETIGSLLGVLAFHDAYHTGQTGVLRRIIGNPPANL